MRSSLVLNEETVVIMHVTRIAVAYTCLHMLCDVRCDTVCYICYMYCLGTKQQRDNSETAIQTACFDQQFGGQHRENGKNIVLHIISTLFIRVYHGLQPRVYPTHSHTQPSINSC